MIEDFSSCLCVILDKFSKLYHKKAEFERSFSSSIEQTKKKSILCALSHLLPLLHSNSFLSFLFHVEICEFAQAKIFFFPTYDDESIYKFDGVQTWINWCFFRDSNVISLNSLTFIAVGFIISIESEICGLFRLKLKKLQKKLWALGILFFFTLVFLKCYVPDINSCSSCIYDITSQTHL